MNPNAPMSLVVASHGTRDAAEEDFTTVWGARYDGDFHHTAVAVLARDADHELHVQRHNSTAKHLLWGGALLGGALFVLAPGAGVGMLAAVGPSGAGAIIGHIRHAADPAELAELADLLDESTWGLVVVVLNRCGGMVTPLLAQADRRASVDMPWGDLEEELCQDVARPLSALVGT